MTLISMRVPFPVAAEILNPAMQHGRNENSP